MGLFDKIKQAAVAAGEGYAEAYDWAIMQDIMTIHEALKETKITEVAKINGYKQAFREKCVALNTDDLLQVYKAVRPKGISINLKPEYSKDIVEDILVDRGILQRDSDGTIM